MIKVGKKEALYGYVDIILAQLANIIVLPIVLNMVSTEEYAIWNVFVSIQAFVILFESGFAIVVARFTTYAYTGAESIPISGKPDIKRNFVNYELLHEILSVSKRLYMKVALIATVVLLLATGYVWYIARECKNLREIIIAWIIFSIGVALSLYFTFYSSFLKGIGKIKEMRIISITSSLMQAILKISLIIMGWGLIGISLTVTVIIIYKRFSIRYYVLQFFAENEKKKYVEREEKKSEIKRAMRANARQLGMVVIAQYIENQGTTLICSAFLPLTIIGRYGLTLQILSVIASVATVPTSTFQPVLNQYVINEKEEKLRDLYGLLTVIITGTYWMGIVVVLTIVPSLLVIVKSKTYLLDGFTMLLMAFYQFEIILHQRATKLISYANDQRYVRSYIVTATAELLVAIITLNILDAPITIYILGLAIAELYNFISWPKRACRLIGYSVSLSYYRGIEQLIQYIKKVVRAKMEKNNRRWPS